MHRIFTILLFLSFFTSIFAQKKQIKALTSIASAQRVEGYFNYYWDAKEGRMWLEVDKFNQEFLYSQALSSGLGSNDIGLDRGQLNQEKIVYFNRIGKKILLIQPNYQYRALSTDPAEQKAVKESFAQSAIWGFEAVDFKGKTMIDFTPFLLRDAHNVVDKLKNQKQGTYSLEASRSAMYMPRTKNFPLNSEFEAILTFIGGSDAGNYVQSVTPSNEAITLRTHHSLVKLPDDGFEKRVFDPRSSYIPISYYDYSTPVEQPIEKFYAIRHRLKKKDPKAAISEAVKPIVYYLDNGTPEPIRSALLDGARWWNQAYEAAGYKNAFQVEVLPKDADPMDIRYNMINWVHRSTRGWSYGASVIDPRTGEIIKGQVSLGSLRVRQDFLIATGLLSPFEDGKPKDERMLQMALARLRQLSAHEIGHTLGIMHNYAASVSNRASVMDYPHPTIKLDANGNIDLSDAYDTAIGDWDKVSIIWGYQDFVEGTDKQTALNKILTDAQQKGLQFISDRDARAAGGLHPSAHLWDNGKNPIDELDNVLKIRQKALSKFGENAIPKGTPMAFLEDVLVPMYYYHRYQTEAVTKIIGGENYTYALRGDGQMVTEKVSKELEIKALDKILQTVSSENLTLNENIIKLIPPRPAGYEFNRELIKKRTGLAFDPLAAAESSADYTFAFLFNVERANRLVEHEARFGTLGLEEMLQKTIKNIWETPLKNGLEKQVQLQTQQIMLSYLMSLSVNDNAAFQTKAIANKALKDLKIMIETAKNATKNSQEQAHLDFAIERMKTPAAAKTLSFKEIPPGAPIGTCEHD